MGLLSSLSSDSSKITNALGQRAVALVTSRPSIGAPSNLYELFCCQGCIEIALWAYPSNQVAEIGYRYRPGGGTAHYAPRHVRRLMVEI